MAHHTSSPHEMSGGCLCGDIRYTFGKVQTRQVFICHCLMCRKAVGCPVAMWMSMPLGALQWESGGDRIRKFRSAEDCERWFCGNCGCSLFMKYDFEQHTIWPAVGSLDEGPGRGLDSLPEGTRHIFCSSLAPWETLPMDGLPRCHECEGWIRDMFAPSVS
eukprot:TRINITY_DN9353_c0_g1_i1.p1 TRINITY_DN9353_c0_g1~~TRINITY_DN9353_c0_g1_i1.p1  ORF type:complete len:161 (+),score=12.65 TRINITY_DN9353_c0_g1_i1:30-512(+)